MSEINGSSEERLNSDFVPTYTYEVEAMRVIPGQEHQSPQPVERCKAEEAQFWSVYRRPVEHADEQKPRLAEWLCDWKTKAAADHEADCLRRQEHMLGILDRNNPPGLHQELLEKILRSKK